MILQRLPFRLKSEAPAADNEMARPTYSLRRLLIVASVALVTSLMPGQQSSAQTLTFSIFERYLDSLRVEAGIPGLSAAVLQKGVIVWERGFGRQDVDAAVAATPDTPYVIGDVSQTMGGTLLLKKCIDESYAELSDRVIRWAPQFPEPSTTLRQLLTHAAPTGGFQYDTSRFAKLTAVVEECTDVPYSQVLVEEIFERLGMRDSVPAHAMGAFSAADRAALGSGRLAHFEGVLRRLALPYRVDLRNRTATKTPVPAHPADTSNGVVTTVRDFARFDSALDSGVLLPPSTRDLAWTQATPLPTGLGWFVQGYNGEPLVWQFGLVKDAYSSLVLKVPNRRLTLILLANSDGLSAPFALQNGDVTASLFAKLFLRLLVV
jgi:CubicO group peptidase (beta-lactamase class C family)